MKTKRTLFDHPEAIDDGIAYLMIGILLAPWVFVCLYAAIHLFHPSE